MIAENVTESRPRLAALSGPVYGQSLRPERAPPLLVTYNLSHALTPGGPRLFDLALSLFMDFSNFSCS